MEKNVNSNSKKKQNIIFAIVVIAIMVLIVGISYAWFSTTIKGSTTQVIQSGDLSLTIEKTRMH